MQLEFVVTSFIVLVLSLSFHEAAHAWTANRLGDPTARQLGRLTLNPLAHIDLIGTVLFPLIAMVSGVPLIGWARPVPVGMQYLREPRRDFAIIALAGPVSNLILAVAGAVLFKGVLAAGTDQSIAILWLAAFFQTMVLINVLLAVFNMIPIPPLDGGNVLMGLVPGSAARAIGWLRPYGIIILYVLMFSGILFQVTMPIRRALLGWLL